MGNLKKGFLNNAKYELSGYPRMWKHELGEVWRI